ncbi:MAG: VOC family protein, partial [Chloroflexota bacterium]
VLNKGSEHNINFLSFQLQPDASLPETAKLLKAAGVSAELQSDPQPGMAEALKIADPDGYALYLYQAGAFNEQGFGTQGIVPQKLGHVALLVQDIQKTVTFYTDVLGFRWSDWIADFFVFMRCGPDHHSMNFLERPSKGVHHVAYQLRDAAHMQAASDWLAQHKIPLIWGPGRHGPGHNLFTYHADPDGTVIELFAELDLMLDEALGYFEPKPYHEEFPQRPKHWDLTPQAPNKYQIMPPEGFL